MSNRTSSLASVLALAGLALVQEPRTRPDDPRQELATPWGYGQIDAAAHKGMQGIWRLERIVQEYARYEGQNLNGFMLIDEGHLAYEFHASDFDDRGFEFSVSGSAIARYQFNQVGQLEMILMIGTEAVDVDWGFSEGGEVRRFRVRYAGDVLLLDSPDIQIALRLNRHVHQAVAGEQVQHVVEKADAGFDRRLARSVQVQAQRDFCLLGLAGDRCRTCPV